MRSPAVIAEDISATQSQFNTIDTSPWEKEQTDD